jgi:hypothetical protein
MQTEPAYDSGLDRKERGMKLALAGNKLWRVNAIAKITALPVGWIGTGEDIRHAVADAPSHHNSWGALVAALLKAELIFPTGDYQPMKEKTSNGRKTTVYERM